MSNTAAVMAGDVLLMAFSQSDSRFVYNKSMNHNYDKFYIKETFEKNKNSA